MADRTTILFHLGAPSRNLDRLTNSLRKNNELLSAYGAMARRPRHYRQAIENRLMEIKIEGEASTDTDTFLAKLCQKQDVDRLLLSDGTFLGPIEQAVSTGGLYLSAAEHIARLTDLFPDNPVEFFLEIRNPLTFINELAAMSQGNDAILSSDQRDHQDLNWLSVVEALKSCRPNSPITIWRHEDLPLVWPEILRSITGVPNKSPMQGDLDQAVYALPENAGNSLTKFIEDRPELSFEQRRYVLSSFLDAASHQPEENEQVDLGAQFASFYQSDCEKISTLEGVRFIQ